MEPQNATHDYIGIAPCGCVVAALYDLGDRWTAGEVSDLIKSGYKVERVPVYEAVARLTEDRGCPKHPQPKRQPRQEALFE